MLLTCNRDDFLHLAATEPHHGIVITIRRGTRGEDRVTLFRLLDRAGETASETTSTSPDQRDFKFSIGSTAWSAPLHAVLPDRSQAVYNVEAQVTCWMKVSIATIEQEAYDRREQCSCRLQ
jgi:hypothetical protein